MPAAQEFISRRWSGGGWLHYQGSSRAKCPKLWLTGRSTLLDTPCWMKLLGSLGRKVPSITDSRLPYSNVSIPLSDPTAFSALLGRVWRLQRTIPLSLKDALALRAVSNHEISYSDNLGLDFPFARYAPSPSAPSKSGVSVTGVGISDP